ncbi:hypothetical protein AB4K20DRAFT_1887482 [Rhizopus microsporus]
MCFFKYSNYLIYLLVLYKLQTFFFAYTHSLFPLSLSLSRLSTLIFLSRLYPTTFIPIQSVLTKFGLCTLLFRKEPIY